MLSLIADVVGIMAFVALLIGWHRGKRLLKATQHAVEQAMVDLQGRHLAALLSDLRWAAADFQRSCRDSDWHRAQFGADLLRQLVSRMLSAKGLTERERAALLVAFDDIKLVHEKVRRTPAKLPTATMTALDSVVDTINQLHGQRAVPALAAGESP
jgi:hypothetical protein